MTEPYAVHKALRLARYLSEAGAETPEENAVVALAQQLMSERSPDRVIAVSERNLEAQP